MLRSRKCEWWVVSGAVGNALRGVPRLALSCALVLLTGFAFAQDKPEPPRILLAAPLAIAPGKPTTVTLRGIMLEETSRVEIIGVEGLTELPIRKKEKTGLPPQVDVKEAGDTHVEIELTLPEGFTGQTIALTLETPAGKTAPYELLVLPADKLIAEVEPNGGFRQPQVVELGKTVAGSIHQQRDVDVFQFTGTAGQQIVAEVTAHRRGSVHDASLSLFDAQGRLLATADDTPAGRDPVLNFTLPADGQYFLSLIDAHDRGGPTHPYLLQVR
jgi:hypothetical protein